MIFSPVRIQTEIKVSLVLPDLYDSVELGNPP